MTAPPPVPSPALQRFLDARRLDYRTAAAALESSHETVRRCCLPFDDPERRVPAPPLMARIVKWTEGAVRPADFYPAELNTGVAA